jgi:hypothetical protein
MVAGGSLEAARRQEPRANLLASGHGNPGAETRSRRPPRVGGFTTWQCSASDLVPGGSELIDESAVGVLRRKVAVDVDTTAGGSDLGSANRVKAWTVIGLPPESDPAALPGGKVVEVNPVAEQQLVLVSGAGPVERAGCLRAGSACVAQRPVAPAVERATGGVGLAPGEVVDHVCNSRAQPEPGVDVRLLAGGLGESSAGDAGRRASPARWSWQSR